MEHAGIGKVTSGWVLSVRGPKTQEPRPEIATFFCKILLTLRSSCRNILCHRAFPYYDLGWPFEYGPQSLETFARENRSKRRNLHGNEEEGKEEETLTVSGPMLADNAEFPLAS